MSLIKKVYAYITQADRLLVFRHVDFPEAGVQVPGGTIKPGEEPAAAVLREAQEETGLEGLSLVSFLGSDEWRVSEAEKEQINLRYFYHLECEQNVPQTWQHYEHHPSEGPAEPILFEFYWLPVSVAADSLPPYFHSQLGKLPGINFQG